MQYTKRFHGTWLDFKTTKPKDSKDKIVRSRSRGVGFGWYSELVNAWFFHYTTALGGGYFLRDIDLWAELPDAP